MKETSHHQQNLIIVQARQQRFNNRWSISEKPNRYDALGDPHTSYYFSNKSVKQHLKQFKRAIGEQTNITEKVRLKKLISLRMKQKFDDFLCPKTFVYQQEAQNLQNSRSKDKILLKSISQQKSQKSLKEGVAVESKLSKVKSRTKKKFRAVKGQLLPINIPATQHSHYTQKQKRQIIEQKQLSIQQNKKSQNGQVQFANRLADELHSKKHHKWLQFLQDKRKLLSPLKQKDRSERLQVNKQISIEIAQNID